MSSNLNAEITEIKQFVEKALAEINAEMERFMKASKYPNCKLAKIHLHTMQECLQRKVELMFAGLKYEYLL